MKGTIFILSSILFIGCSNPEMKNQSFSDKEEYYVLRGINHSQNNDCKNAAEQLNVAYKKNSENTIVMKELAYCYFSLGEIDRSLEFYKKVLKKQPKDEIALKNLAYINYQKGDFTQAQRYLNEITEAEKDLFYYKLYGYTYFDEKKYQLAYNYFNTVLEMEKEYDNNYFEKYIETLLKLEKDGELYKVLQEKYAVYYLKKEYVKIYSTIIVDKFKEYEKGERAIKRYIVENPNDNEMIFNLVELNVKSGNYSKGKEQLKFISDDYKYNKRYIELVDILERKE